MPDEYCFSCPPVGDTDIVAACHLLGLPAESFFGADGSDPRQDVLMCMDSLDIAACPGSGKTTLLVAKLAILASRWTLRTRGICVISHTNAARRVIEERLGNTNVGRRVLAHPHFVGTIHSFAGEFLALPWLRSRGVPVKLINTEVCQSKRWRALPQGMRTALQKHGHEATALRIASASFEPRPLKWGKQDLAEHTAAYQAVKSALVKTAALGWHCYDDLFVWAHDLMDKQPQVVTTIRGRFPIVFVDEAQDNSEEQAAFLVRLFGPESGTVRQRFGDENQAIYGFVGGSQASTDRFPSAAKRDLPNSHRFDQMIADLAKPLGIAPHTLAGQGPRSPLASGSAQPKHTVFLFERESTTKVLDAYGELLVQTFSKDELRRGEFVAVGLVHRPADTSKPGQHPHDVGDYWEQYDPQISGRDPTPNTLIQYLRAGQSSASATGEAHPAVEKLAVAVLRLAGLADGAATGMGRRYNHRFVVRRLQDRPCIMATYQQLASDIAARRLSVSADQWEKCWKDRVKDVAQALAAGPLDGDDVAQFLAWESEGGQEHASSTVLPQRGAVYCYPSDASQVHIRLGSIHSVKGATHTATLVLETFWHAHNLEKLLEWIDGRRSGGEGEGVYQQTRLKTHYVAMTRATHLLCLAMKRSSFENAEGNLDPNCVGRLTERGWRVQEV